METITQRLRLNGTIGRNLILTFLNGLAAYYDSLLRDGMVGFHLIGD